MECRYAMNASAAHPEEVMQFRSFKEAPGYDFHNVMHYGGMSVPGELSRPSSLLFDMVQAGLQASQKLAALNYVSCNSEFAKGSCKSYAPSYDSRTPEETDIFRPHVDGFEDNLGYSRSSSTSTLGTLLPLLDRDVKTPQVTASKEADDQGILREGEGEEGTVTELVMEKILRDHFQDASQLTYNLQKAPTNSSTFFPVPTLSEIKELEFRPFLESMETSSAQIECGMSPEPSPSGLPDRLSESMATSEFMSVRPSFRRPVEVTHRGQFKTNYRKWKQQRPSVSAQGPSPSFRATSSGEMKSKTRARNETDAMELRSGSRPERRRIRIARGDSSGETQRMTHIAVERNRRKQMNDHLAALKALMPSTFVQKTDQASIIGGAVEFVKELEVLLESLQSMQRRRTYAGILGPSWSRFNANPGPVLRIAPPYSTPSIFSASTTSEGLLNRVPERTRISSGLQLATVRPENAIVRPAEVRAECRSAVATVEVKVLENDAIVNITTRWRAKQLVKVIVAIERLDLSILHASITTSQSTVLYTFNAKVGPQCRMTVNQVAAALHQTFDGLNHAIHS